MIRVTLLEEAAVWEDENLVLFPYKKAEALFYYICQERKTTRDKAAALLWADNDTQTARKNLRNALYQIRKLLGQDVLLLKGNTRIEINTERVRSDIYELTGENILERFTNTFLENYTVRGCEAFNAWITRVKDEYRKMYTEKADEYIRSCIWRGDLDRIRDLMEHFYILQIVDEAIYRRIMRAYLGSGRYSDALNVYRNLEELLHRESERKPSYETVCLVKEIRESQNRMLSKRPETEQTHFWGRGEELNRIHQSRQSMLITGENGTGKTAFLDRYLEMLNGEYTEVVKYTCYEAGIGLPYRPFLEICEVIHGFLGDRRYYGQFQDQIYLEDSVSARVERMVETLIRKVIQENGKSLVLILDDFQWIDKESAVLLQILIRRMKGEDVRFILAADCEALESIQWFYRPLVQEEALEHLELPVFDQQDCENFIRNQLQACVIDEHLNRIIYQMTKGKILFMRALLWMIRNKGIEILNETEEPVSIDALMEKFFWQVGLHEMKILQVLSCQAEFLTFRELQRVTGMDEVEAAGALENLIEQGIIKETNTFAGIGYCYCRKYVRKQIYKRISEEKRKEYHKSIAECIIKEFGKFIRAYPYIIYHFREAGEVHRMYEYRLEYYIYYFTPVHEAFPDQMDCFEADIPWTRQFVNHEAIEEIVDEIRELTRDQQEPADEYLLMKTEFLYGRYALFSGNRNAGMDSIGRCEVLAAKRGDASYLYRCAIRKLFYLIEVRDLENVQPYLERVEKRSYDSVQNRATYLRIKGLYEIKCCEYKKARRTLESALRNYDMITYEDIFANLGRSSCLNCLCEIAIEERDYAGALRFVSDSIESSRFKDRKYTNGWHYVNLMRIMYDQKMYPMVYQYAELANGIFKRSGTVWGVGHMEMILSMTCMEERKYTEALDHLQNAYTYAIKAGYLHAPQKLDRIYKKIRGIMEDEKRIRLTDR